MANHKSAKKRARASEAKRQRNRQYISAVRTTVKKFKAAVTEGQDAAKVQELFKSAQSLLAKAAAKGLLHQNNAARRIGRLAANLKSLGDGGASAAKAAPKKKSVASKAKTAAPKAAAAPAKKAAPTAAKKPATATKAKKPTKK